MSRKVAAGRFIDRAVRFEQLENRFLLSSRPCLFDVPAQGEAARAVEAVNCFAWASQGSGPFLGFLPGKGLLSAGPRAGKKDVVAAMGGHIVAEGELIGTYEGYILQAARHC